MLGPPTVTVDGGPPPPPLLWRKLLTLLVYLARSPKHSRSREHLMGLLWPEQTDRRARGSLNETLRLLRANGGRDLLKSVSDQVQLDSHLLQLDVDLFDAFVSEERWAEAAALVGGEFLEGFVVPNASGVDEWLRLERDTWRRKSVDALARLADRLREGGDPVGAMAPAQRALDLDPYSDAAIRALMRALARRGQKSAALESYDAFAARLFESLGTKPDQETEQQAQWIRAGRFGPRHDTPVPERPERAPLAGRKAELSRLLQAWRECRRGRKAALALILGDPGTGKSRLAEEILQTAALDGATVAATRAVEADLTEPWSGFASLVDGGLSSAPGIAATPPTALGAFVARSPNLADRFPGVAASKETLVGKAFSQLARTACGERPLVILLDDAQWTDRESLLGLGALLRDVAKLPCFVIVAASMHPPRTEVAELRSRIGRGVNGLTVSLKGLSLEDLRALAHWALPSYDGFEIDRVSRRIATDSGGLPLLAIELLRGVASGLELLKTGSAWPEPLKTLQQTFPGELPEAVTAAITVNFRRLSKDAQRVVSAVAVLGGRLSVAAIRRAADLASPALNAALDELEWLGWLQCEARGYSFVARVVALVVEQSLVSSGERARIKAL